MDNATLKNNRFDTAVELFGGNASALARFCRVTPQAVSQWRKRGEVPLIHAIRLSREFKIPRNRLIPERFR